MGFKSESYNRDYLQQSLNIIRQNNNMVQEYSYNIEGFSHRLKGIEWEDMDYQYI